MEYSSPDQGTLGKLWAPERDGPADF